ncbi:transcription initiation factor IIB family protein [Haladaptatus sp. CMAA 1911]|uniref:transcription initiation factor IIB n=1 Tax=unclassified Haladaptatus TaxID=2622732 RepID=UPI003754BC18
MAIRDIYEDGFDDELNEAGTPCPECNGRVSTNSLETVCENCGLVLFEDRIDRGPEWFDDEQKTRIRTGSPLTPTLHDYGLTTEIYGHTDATGRTISPSKQRQVSRLQTHHRRASWGSKENRNLGHGFSEIRRLVSALSLSSRVRDRTCTLFKTAQTNNLLRGRSIESVASACVYATIRCLGLPRTLPEIIEYSKDSEATIRGVYRVLNTELDLPTQPPQPSGYVAQIASSLAIPRLVESRAKHLSRWVSEAEFVIGCNPTGVAAACLAVAAAEHGVPVLQTDLADAASVSTRTVRVQRNRIQDELERTESVQ